jgi:outer membrane receptor protein involved in Fe transport
MGDVYQTRDTDDILFVAAGPTISSGYFANVGATQRRGAELSLRAVWNSFDARATYGLVLATFETPFAIPSADNPAANAAGNIYVHAGDFLPNIPRHSFKLGLGWQATSELHLGFEAHAESDVFLRGDEANLQKPLAGYIECDADIDYKFAPGYTFYVTGENIFDNRYATFGLYGDPTGGGAFPQFTNPRFTVPAAPVEGEFGLRVTF